MPDPAPTMNGRKVIGVFVVLVLVGMGLLLLSVYAGDGPIWDRETADVVNPGEAATATPGGATGSGSAVPATAAPTAGVDQASANPATGDRAPVWPIHVGVRCEDERARQFSVYANGTRVGELQIACTTPLPPGPQADLLLERADDFVLRVQDDTGEHLAEYEVFPSAETWVLVTHRVLDGRSFATSFETSFDGW